MEGEEGDANDSKKQYKPKLSLIKTSYVTQVMECCGQEG